MNGRVLPRSTIPIALAILAGWSPAPAAGPEAHARIDRLVRPFVDSGLALGLVVGVLDGDGSRVFGFGRIQEGSEKAPGGDTAFEIGSITKVFTAVVLQRLVEKGQVKLDEPVAKLLPESVKVPRRGDREITLIDLATHTSGLPRLPGNLESRNPDDPYAGYTAEMLHAFLSNHELARTPGTKYEYSNLGTALLGHALARRAGKPYEELVLSLVCEPCGLKDTRITLDDRLRKRLAPGHDADGVPAASWTFDVIAPAGALRSTANDLLRFAAANLGLVETPLRDTLEAAHKVRDEKSGMGLGWHRLADRRTIFHNGGTGGFRSFLALDKERKLAVVVLANTALEEVDALAVAVLEVLRGREPKPLEVRWPVKVAPADLERVCGEYELAPGAVLTVSRDGGKLFAQLIGQPRARIYPASVEKYFYRIVDAEITFEREEKGKGRVKGLVLHQNGRDQRAKRKR